MLDKTPNESEWLSWVYAGIAALAIFVTVPLARALQKFVTDTVGRPFFLYVTAFALVVAAIVAVRSLGRRKIGIAAYVWLLGIGIVYSTYIYGLRKNPEEAMHFVQYGVLSLLVYRALIHRVRDSSVYVTATLISASVGVLDEVIQWLTPGRFGELRDMRLNMLAGGLMQLAIATGLRPSIVAQRPNAAGLRTLFVTAALSSVLLGLAFAVTPGSVSRLIAYVPSFAYLENKQSGVIVDYGHLFIDPYAGTFRSRFSKDQLAENDRTRGAVAAEVMDNLVNEDNYSVFLTQYNEIRDPYIHAVGVHLFRRNRYLSRAISGGPDRAEHYHVALHENRILETYFPTALRQSTHRWTEEKLSQVEENALKDQSYESPVSGRLITRISKEKVLSGLGFLSALFVLLAILCGRQLNSSKHA